MAVLTPETCGLGRMDTEQLQLVHDAVTATTAALRRAKADGAFDAVAGAWRSPASSAGSAAPTCSRSCWSWLRRPTIRQRLDHHSVLTATSS
jgi:hypothetical protein